MMSVKDVASRDFFHSPGKKLLVTLGILFFGILAAAGFNPGGLIGFWMFPEGLVLFLRVTRMGATCLENAVSDGCSDLFLQLIGYGWALYLALVVTIALVHRRWLVILLYLVFLVLVGGNVAGCRIIGDDFCRGGC